MNSDGQTHGQAREAAQADVAGGSGRPRIRELPAGELASYVLDRHRGRPRRRTVGTGWPGGLPSSRVDPRLPADHSWW